MIEFLAGVIVVAVPAYAVALRAVRTSGTRRTVPGHRTYPAVGPDVATTESALGYRDLPRSA